MSAKRKDRFVVGYRAAKNCIYGKEMSGKNIDPMTKFQAARHLKSMPCKGACVFELISVRSQK